MTAADCRNCHRVPGPGERHHLCDGITQDGEPLGFTCLDTEGEVIYDPPACSTCRATGPCPCPSPWAAPS